MSATRSDDTTSPDTNGDPVVTILASTDIVANGTRGVVAFVACASRFATGETLTAASRRLYGYSALSAAAVTPLTESVPLPENDG